MKTKWAGDELKPYLKQVCDDDGMLNVLLTEYTKMEKNGDDSVYVAK